MARRARNSTDGDDACGSHAVHAQRAGSSETTTTSRSLGEMRPTDCITNQRKTSSRKASGPATTTGPSREDHASRNEVRLTIGSQAVDVGVVTLDRDCVDDRCQTNSQAERGRRLHPNDGALPSNRRGERRCVRQRGTFSKPRMRVPRLRIAPRSSASDRIARPPPGVSIVRAIRDRRSVRLRPQRVWQQGRPAPALRSQWPRERRLPRSGTT